MSDLPHDRVYANRFSPKLRAEKAAVWRVVCADFLQRYVPRDAAILDLGAGYGEFINNIAGARKVAIDMNPELPSCLEAGIKAIAFDVNSGEPLPDGPYDVVFASNFFEHLRDKGALTKLVARIHEALRPGGRLLVLGPNIRVLHGEYWDFYDHHVALSDRSVTELLVASGFEIEECIPRFLPYTMKSRLPSWPFLVRAFLRFPLAWRIFGGQFFVVARRT